MSTPLISLHGTQFEPKTEKNVLFTHSARQRKLDRWRENPDAASPGSSVRTSTGSTNTTTHQPGFDSDSESNLLTGLETATAKGVQTLKELQYVLLKDPTSWNLTSESTGYWPAEISKVKAHAEPVRTLIGVLGAPGAGKTSLINAIVGEEGLLPTNCMRASTAVVTEVAYNDHSAAKYRAEIDFVSRSAWNAEVQVLVKDMNDHGREEIPPEGSDFRSEAAVAVEKIRAVYPMLSVEEIMDSSAEELCEREIVLAGKVLGETVVIENEDPRVFSRDLAAYIDSKGKKKRTPNPNNNNANASGSSGDVKGKAPMRTIFDNSVTSSSPSPSAIEYWPFVRVVRIYVKAKSLSTGATLVDLPSIIDSSAPRAAVAEEYMQKCAAHWIVSPINRAIDERVARDLLSPNLRLQLHMDGAVDTLTFVCTKTDDVSVSEVQEALLRRDLPSPSLGSERSAKCKELGQDVRILNKRLAQMVTEAKEIDYRVELLGGGRGGDGESPASDDSRGSPGKRKRDNATSVSSVSSSDSSDSSILGSRQRSLEEDLESDIEETILALGERRRDLCRERRTLLNEITAKKVQKANLEAEIEDQKINLVHDCIIARNEYAKRDLQRDFAHGIHDFCNQGLLSTVGSGVYYHRRNPEQDLPVFCVSTCASQKFKGRLRKEASVYGFAKLEETEVPQLQDHCIQITEKAREDSALRFLLQLRQLLNSISLCASAGGGMRAWKQQRDEVESRVHGAIEVFKKVCPISLCLWNWLTVRRK